MKKNNTTRVLYFLMSYIPVLEVAVRDFWGRYTGISDKTITTAMQNKMHNAHIPATNVYLTVELGEAIDTYAVWSEYDE